MSDTPSPKEIPKKFQVTPIVEKIDNLPVTDETQKVADLVGFAIFFNYIFFYDFII